MPLAVLGHARQGLDLKRRDLVTESEYCFYFLCLTIGSRDPATIGLGNVTQYVFTKPRHEATTSLVGEADKVQMFSKIIFMLSIPRAPEIVI